MLSNGKRLGKNVIIFGADMSQSMHIDNKKKDILILGKSPADGLDDTTLTAEKEYSINFAITQKKFFLSLHSNSGNSYIIVSSVEIYKFKAKYSEINAASLCLGKMKKIGLYRYVSDFSVDDDTIDVDDHLDIHKYFMKKNKILIGFI